MIISDGERLNLVKGSGCLEMALRICFKTKFFDPPCETILSHSILARGMKSLSAGIRDAPRVQRLILQNRSNQMSQKEDMRSSIIPRKTSHVTRRT